MDIDKDLTNDEDTRASRASTPDKLEAEEMGANSDLGDSDDLGGDTGPLPRDKGYREAAKETPDVTPVKTTRSQRAAPIRTPPRRELPFGKDDSKDRAGTAKST